MLFGSKFRDLCFRARPCFFRRPLNRFTGRSSAITGRRARIHDLSVRHSCYCSPIASDDTSSGALIERDSIQTFKDCWSRKFAYILIISYPSPDKSHLVDVIFLERIEVSICCECDFISNQSNFCDLVLVYRTQ